MNRSDVTGAIRACGPRDLPQILSIINDAAQAYRGVIPADRWHDPYMPMQELQEQIAQGVAFSGCEVGEDARRRLVGVMGIQDRGEVTLIRHAYVRTDRRRQGVGEKLLKHLERLTAKPVLIGTWADAGWAIRFYEKNGYRVLSRPEAGRLLRRYWAIPERQIETSVVLANSRWRP